MTDFLLQFVPLVSQLSIPAAVVIVFTILWQSKVFEVITLRLQSRKEGSENKFNQINNNTNSKNIIISEGRIKDLEDFKFNMETNHNTDLAKLLAWRDVTEPRLSKIDERLDKIADDTAFIRGKLTK